MSRRKYDGVIEAARYRNGELLWVRAYERRGATFSDALLIERQPLIERLEQGKEFVTGRRTRNMAGTFTVSKQVRVLKRDGRPIISTSPDAIRDSLDEVPVI